MTTSVNPVPTGIHTVVAYVCVHDAAEAIAFYTKAVGATDVSEEEMLRRAAAGDKNR